MENLILTKEKVLQINEDTFILIFEEDPDFSPGQFVMMETPALVRKPFILGKWMGKTAISVKIRGKGTKYLVFEATQIRCHLPLGNPFVPPNERGMAIVSTASITMAFMLNEIYGVEVLVGSRTPLVMKLPFETVVGDNAFEERIKKLDYEWYLISGSIEMEKKVWNILKKRKTEVFLALEEYMGCGIGACKSCAIQTKYGIKHVCTDGPIFRGDELCW